MNEGALPAGPQDDGQNLYQPDQVIAPSNYQTPTPSPEPWAAAPQTPEVVPAAEVPDDDGAITWSASEFEDHQKSSRWYLLLAASAVGVSAVVWLLTRDPFPTAAVLIGVVLLGVYAGRQPHQETYTLDEHGLMIGNRHFGYHEFRSFAVVPDDELLSIELTPLKRFSVGMTLYANPANADKIIDHLSLYLPMEEAKPSLADSVMRRIKF
jgi:hypothetical protein